MKTIKQSGPDDASETGTTGLGSPVVPVKALTAKDVVGNDEHAGQGGSYVFDPETGLRVPSDETVAARAEAKRAHDRRAAEKAAEQEVD